MKAFELIKYIKKAVIFLNIYDSQVIPGNLFLETSFTCRVRNAHITKICVVTVAVGWVERSETQHNRRVTLGFYI